MTSSAGPALRDWRWFRREALREGLEKIATKDRLSIVQPFFPFDGEIDRAEVLYADDTHFDAHPDFTCDIFFGQGNHIDIAKLAKIRQSGRAILCANWFWDNHHLYGECMQIAMLTDVYFAGHKYKSAYLKNELSLNGGFVPMLSITWTREELKNAASRFLLAPRSDALYGGYNSYPQFAHRDILIREVVSLVEDSAVFITAHGTPPSEHPFNRMTSEQRLAQWMRYKVCLCVSVDRDITMRMFDTLLTGGVPLVVGRPDDLDQVISRELQAALPIVVVESKNPVEVAAAYKTCLRAFDNSGVDGVLMRHCFARDNHMSNSRLEQMVKQIRTFAADAAKPTLFDPHD